MQIINKFQFEIFVIYDPHYRLSKTIQRRGKHGCGNLQLIPINSVFEIQKFFIFQEPNSIKYFKHWHPHIKKYKTVSLKIV